MHFRVPKKCLGRGLEKRVLASARLIERGRRKGKGIGMFYLVRRKR